MRSHERRTKCHRSMSLRRWCRRLTTCLLHVGPPFVNRFLNTGWAVGLTYWIVYLNYFCILTYAIVYVLIHYIIFWLYLYFSNILYFFKYSCSNIFHRRSLCTFYRICFTSPHLLHKIDLVNIIISFYCDIHSTMISLGRNSLMCCLLRVYYSCDQMSPWPHPPRCG